MIGYGKQWISDVDIEAVVRALKSDWLTQGPTVEAFEDSFKAYVRAEHAVSVSNGTAALHLAVKALDLDAGSIGITTPNTFMATSNAMLYNDIKPVFADISLQSYNLSVDKALDAISEKTSVIIPVHFAGQPFDVELLSGQVNRAQIKIIEDAAHAVGSRYRCGAKVGCCKYSDVTTFSFHPVKTMTTCEGGMITTNDETLYKRLLRLRSHGIERDRCLYKDKTERDNPWYHEMHDLGFNYRLSDVHAALGLSQLSRLEDFIERRREIVQWYKEHLADIPWLILPEEGTGLRSAFHLFVVLIDFLRLGVSRKDVMQRLREKGIGTQVHYIPVYRQPYYQRLLNIDPNAFPNMENYYAKALSLPLYPSLTESDLQQVASAIKALHA